MSRQCDITGKAGLNGNRVSHAHNKTHHVQRANVKKKRIFVPELRRYITLKLSSKGMKELDRRGAYRVLKERGLI
jgi:large subunit ribosomal protein L28